MQLRIENIGPIGSAVIELTGLTVIGGYNDTGKSTIGKSLFSIVKSIRNRELEYGASRQIRINNSISNFVSVLRRHSGSNISPSFTSFVKRVIDVDSIDLEINPDRLGNNLSEIKQKITEYLTQREILNTRYFQKEQNDERAELRSAITGNFTQELRSILTEKRDEQHMYATSFDNVIRNAFRGEINNKRIRGTGKISLFQNSLPVFDSEFENNSIKSMHVYEDMLGELFEDATLVESPFVLNLRPSLNLFRGSYENTFNIDYTTSDLLQKLSFATNANAPQTEDNSNTLEVTISNIIGRTINGRIYFDQNKDDFFFLKDDNVEVRISNTASGIKTLGIIQMLATAGVLGGTNLFIIDEPEVHLHPQWQVICAEVIATLVAKYNVYCIVSSHSPYFLQAIETYSKLYKVENLTKFYISNKVNGSCNFQDVTEDTEPLYKLLSGPMKEIMYLQTKSEE
jgi:hypothetical protein